MALFILALALLLQGMVLPFSSVLAQTMKCRTRNCWRNNEGGWSLKVDANHIGALTSDETYKYGDFCAWMKLPRGRTKGTVIAFYLMDTTTRSNKDWRRSEIDTEIYGNENSWNYGYTTNIFAKGRQNLVKFRLAVNGADNYNKYCMRWSRNQIVWSVNEVPYRVLVRQRGDPWPTRPSKIRFSFWECSSYCGEPRFHNGGFVVKIRNVHVNGCRAQEGAQPPAWARCQAKQWFSRQAVWNGGLTPGQRAAMSRIRRNNFKNAYGWQKA